MQMLNSFISENWGNLSLRAVISLILLTLMGPKYYIHITTLKTISTMMSLCYFLYT